MPATLIGRKIGMTRVYNDAGKSVPVTVIQAGPCFVSQVKTEEKDGYNAVQLAYSDVKARNSTLPLIGHDAKAGLGSKRVHREFRVSAEEAEALTLGQELGADALGDVKFVDITGVSKGKGFAGVMKRWGFKGQLASHGVERKHRSPGSVSGRSSNLGTGKPKKGIRMSGRMGSANSTTRSLEVVGADPERNLIWVKGTVPGAASGVLMIKEAKRLYKSKARMAKAS